MVGSFAHMFCCPLSLVVTVISICNVLQQYYIGRWVGCQVLPGPVDIDFSPLV
jgi:hypothetical protein